MQLAQAETPSQPNAAEVPQIPAQAGVDANWNCSAQKPGPGGVAVGPLDQPLTVGETFVLLCEGDSANLKAESLRLELPKDQKYALKILKTQTIEPTKGIFTVTSYQVGDGEIKGAVLTDGTLRVGLNGATFKVNSVIDPQVNPEGKPYSPLEPYALSWPTWIWATLALILALIALFVLNILQASAQRRRLMQELSSHGSAFTPYQQMNKELRAISRQYPLSSPAGWSSDQSTQFLEVLDKTFRWFLAREFEVPAHEWRSRKTLKAIQKKNKRLPKIVLKNLSSALRELDKSRDVSAKLTTLDAAQLVELCRRSADQIYDARKGAAA